MANFHVGQKVVCVNAKIASHAINPPNLIENNIYTISKLFDSLNGPRCFISELPNHGGNWYGYGVARFRPLVETKSEVSFITGADPDSNQWDNRKVKVN